MSHVQLVKQHPSTLRVQEGASTAINCTHVDTASSYFPWYKQRHGKHPKLIIHSGSNMERKQDERLIVLLAKKANYFSMHITDTQPGDSAMYFYVARTHCSPDTCSHSSNLSQGLEPHQHPVPQAFQYSICQLLVGQCQL